MTLVTTKATPLLTDSLKFGQDHPVLKVNIRTTDRDAGMDGFTANIEHDGILQSLLVWRDVDGDGFDYVLAGSRRLTAARRIRTKDPKRFETVDTILRVGGTAAEALAWSLATDIFQLPPHQVDQFEAFEQIRKSMAEAGEKPDAIVKAIATRYGTTELIITRRLALGHLAPAIRDAWKKGDIEPGVAIAFTLQPDQDVQVKLFARLKKQHQLNAWAIRREIAGDDNSAPALLAFVGRADYEKAGGAIIRDLFAEKEGTGDGVSDMPLLTKLAEAKLADEMANLEKDGWSWTSHANAMPPGWHHAWPRLEAPKGKRPWTEADKAKSGVVVQLRQDGDLDMAFGVMKPTPKAKTGSERKASAVHTAGEAEEGFGLSKNMIRSLQRQATEGLAAALKKQPDIALAALLAAFTPGTMSVVRVEQKGIAFRSGGGGARVVEFETVFAHVLKTPRPKVMDGVAAVVAMALDLGYDGLNPEPLGREDAGAIAAAVNSAALNKALREAFDPAEYFDGVPKALCLTAIREAVGAEAHDRVARGSKGDIVKFAIAEVAKTGWLPRELRAACYDGPDGKTATKAKVAPPPKPKAPAKAKKVAKKKK